MRDRRAILTGISVFGIILAIGLLVNGVLGISGFEGVYEDALVSRYNIDGKNIKTRVESSLNLGKKLYLLENNVRPLFSETLESSSGIDHIYIIDTNNKILYSTRNATSQQYIPFNYYQGQEKPSDDLSPYKYKFLDTNFVCIPLFTGEADFTGSVLIEYSKKSVSTFVSPYVSFALKLGIIIFIIALALFITGSLIFGDNYKFENISTIVLLIISQLMFSFFNFQQYNTALGTVFSTNMERLGNSVTSAIEEPLHLTEDFKNLRDVNEYLAERISGNEQCSSIYILDEQNKINFLAHNQIVEGDEVIDLNDKDITVLPIITNSGESAKYQLALKINRPLINSVLRDMALDSGTIIIVALIFAFILKSFIIFVRYKDDVVIEPEIMNKQQERTVLRLIEISTFIFMFAAYETLSFIPLYIQEVIRTSALALPNMAKETLESLPVSTYMFGIMIAMFITLFGMKNLTVKKRYIIMSAVFIAGSVITILSHNIILFAVSRFIAGFGFGGVLLSTSSLVMRYTSQRTRSAGFGTNAAAFASASITSIPVGGVIVNKFGYEAGIVVSIVFAFAFLLFSALCLPNEKKAIVVKDQGTKSSNITLKDFFRVFASRHILTYILFVNIPFQIIYWGLFQFLLPIYMSDTMNLSQGNIGRILGIFSIVSLFAAYVSRLADKARNDKLLIGIGAICAGVAMFVFGQFAGGFFLFMIIMVAMGVDNLFIDSIEEVYLESGHVKNVTEENLLQTYKVIEKVLSVFIPTITTIIIMKSGFNLSMQIIGTYSAIGAILFIIFGKNGRWGKKNER